MPMLHQGTCALTDRLSLGRRVNYDSAPMTYSCTWWRDIKSIRPHGRSEYSVGVQTLKLNTMKKVNLDKVEHIASTTRCGNGNNKRYAFDDFSDNIKLDSLDKLKGLRDKMRKSEPKPKKKKKANKIVRIVPSAGSMRINQTHIVIPCKPWTRTDSKGNTYTGTQQIVVVYRYMTTNAVRRMYPNVLEMWHSIDNEVYGDHVIFANVK